VSSAGANPFIGPRSFRAGEVLYGRARETRKLVNLLIAERIVLLHSPSGAGKSSLIQAALIPRLRERGFAVPRVIRLSTAPPSGLQGANRYVWSTLLSLEEDYAREERLEPAALAALSLDAYLELRLADATSETMLIFDQFEELLTLDLVDRDAKLEFFRQLGQALEARSRWALFAIRGDRLAELEPYARPVPTQFAVRFPLELLRVDAAQDAMIRPVEARGVRFSAAAAERLIDDLRRVRVQLPDGSTEERLGDTIEPVQLQVVGYRLWERVADTSTEIAEGDVTAVGDVDAALAEYYSERVVAIAAASGASERSLRDWCEQQLITDQDVRFQVLMGHGESGGLANKAIQGLVDTHLVRAEPRRGALWYELAHDRLIAPIRKSNAAWREANLSLVQRQADLWDDEGRADGLLLTGDALREGQRWGETNAATLTEIEREFLRECMAAVQISQQQRELVRNRVLAIALGIISAIILIGFTVTFRFYQQAEINRLDAEHAAETAQAEGRRAAAAERIARLTVLSSANFETRPQLGLLFAVEAARSPLDATATLTITAQRELLRQGLRQIGGRPLGRLTEAAVAIAYSPDSRLIAAAAGSTVQIWQRFRPAEPPLTFSLAAAITSLAFSTDGRWLGAAGEAGELRLWPLSEAGVVGEPITLGGHTGRIHALAFHPAGRWLATASGDGTLRLWDLVAQPPTARLLLTDAGDVHAVTFGGDGGRLFAGVNGPDAGATGHAVLVWSMGASGPDPTPQSLETGNPVYLLDASSDSRWVVAGMDELKVALWDLGADPQRPAPAQFKLPGTEWVTAPRFSPDGRWLALPGAVTTLYDLTSGDLTKPTQRLPAFAFIGAASGFSPDGHWLITAGNDRLVRVWDMSNFAEPPLQLRGHERGITAVAFSPDGAALVSADSQGDVREWAVPGFAIDPVQLSGPLQTEGIQLWRSTPGEAVGARRMLTLEPGSYGVAISPSGRWAASIAAGTSLRLWDLSDPSAEAVPLAASGFWAMPIFDPRERWLIGADAAGMVHLWSLDAEHPGELVAEWQAQNGGAVRDLALSADGTRLATAGDGDGLARVWLLDTLRSPAAPQSIDLAAGGGLSWTIRAVAISPDGRWLMAGSWENDNSVRVWDLGRPATLVGTPVAEFNFANRAFDVAFSPDSRWAAAGSWDNTVRLLDLEAATPEWQALTGFAARVLTLDFSPDSRWLAVGSEDRAVRLWDLPLTDLSDPQVVLEGPSKIGFIQFSPDGRWLLTEVGEYASTHFARTGGGILTGDAQTRLYHMDGAELLALACATAGRNLAQDEWQRYLQASSTQPYHDTCPAAAATSTANEQHLLAESLVQRAFMLANTAHASEARQLLEQVRELDPERIDPVVVASFDQVALRAALALVDNRDILRAAQVYAALDADTPGLITAEDWNSLCWQGSLAGYAAELLPACDRAVALDPTNGGIRDSRGLARALTGDLAGAAADFAAFIDWAADTKYAAQIPQREAWIAALQAGQNPFDAATLAKLRQQ